MRVQVHEPKRTSPGARPYRTCRGMFLSFPFKPRTRQNMPRDSVMLMVWGRRRVGGTHNPGHARLQL